MRLRSRNTPSARDPAAFSALFGLVASGNFIIAGIVGAAVYGFVRLLQRSDEKKQDQPNNPDDTSAT